mmetsp:Transcript_28461/g.40530  ORF Transcript_28461/g.40530 Transcript_28461/m.40530 type:complete len:455 (-) Transcript_28461:545-1909(-)
MSVPKVQLNLSLDDMMVSESAPNTGVGVRSIVLACIAENVEDEKCVVAQYRTTAAQKEEFRKHLADHDKNHVPIEWVIDIADESNGWFYGTAYHFDDSTQMLHVMVPDKVSPSFDGNVLLDHRTVHLIECVDGKTDALFNKIVRDSVIKVKWDVEWFEEVEDGAVAQDWGTTEGLVGNWIFSAARYYIRIANQLLVEDKDSGQDSRGFVILTADLNLKLISCHKNKGIDDFNRLINEGTVQATPEAMESARTAAVSPGPASTANNDWHSSSKLKSAGGRSKFGGDSNSSPLGGNESSAAPSLRKVADLSRNLREALGDVLDEREKNKSQTASLAKMFQAFTLDGDLDEGLNMQDYFEKNVSNPTATSNGSSNSNGKSDKNGLSEVAKADAAADDAWYLAQKMEKSLVRLLRSGSHAGTGDGDEDVEHMKKTVRKMRREMEEQSREISRLKNRNN